MDPFVFSFPLSFYSSVLDPCSQKKRKKKRAKRKKKRTPYTPVVSLSCPVLSTRLAEETSTRPTSLDSVGSPVFTKSASLPPAHAHLSGEVLLASQSQ